MSVLGVLVRASYFFGLEIGVRYVYCPQSAVLAPKISSKLKAEDSKMTDVIEVCGADSK